MSRTQTLTAGPTVAMPVAGVAVPLQANSLFVKSLIVQADPANTDFIYIGSALGQTIALEPRRSLKIWGDNMDNGTAAKIDLASIYVVSPTVPGQLASFLYLEGL